MNRTSGLSVVPLQIQSLLHLKPCKRFLIMLKNPKIMLKNPSLWPALLNFSAQSNTLLHTSPSHHPPDWVGGKSLIHPWDLSLGLSLHSHRCPLFLTVLTEHLCNNRCLLAGQQCQACLSCHPGHPCPWHLTHGELGTQEAARDLKTG